MPPEAGDEACRAHGLVDVPIGPGWLRRCAACGRWFALRLVRSEPHPRYGSIRYYRCKRCGQEAGHPQIKPIDLV